MGVNSRAHIFNVELPVAGKNFLSANIKPLFDNSEIRIHIAISKAGKLSLVRQHDADTIVEELNGGTNLEANTGYNFLIPTRFFSSYNFRYSADHGTILVLQVEEISP